MSKGVLTAPFSTDGGTGGVHKPNLLKGVSVDSFPAAKFQRNAGFLRKRERTSSSSCAMRTWKTGVTYKG